MGHSSGNSTDGTSSAPPPPVRPSSSGGGSALRSAAPSAAPLLSKPKTLLSGSDDVVRTKTENGMGNSHRDAVKDELMTDAVNKALEPEGELLVTAVEAAMDAPGEIFYVQLDAESQLITGVLPGMEQLHVQLTKLRRVLQQSGVVLRALRERATSARGDTSPASRLTAARGDAQSPVDAACVAHLLTRPPLPVAPHVRTDSTLSGSPVRLAPMYPCRHGDGDNDEESERCDATAINRSSASITAQRTPSLQPTLMPPPFQLYEEDELDDNDRGSHLSSATGGHRTFVARFLPDSMPSSIQLTPNMHPTSTSPACSGGGDILCLPLSMPSPTVTSPGGSVISRLDSSPLLPPPTNSAHLFDHRDPAPYSSGRASARLISVPVTGRFSEAEEAELVQLSQRVAELYRRRGLLLQKADRILCQHAQQHERWECNEERRGCYRCRRLFSRLTRRHHCRRCGRLCCAECSRYIGKKQDTSYVAPVNSTPGFGATVAHRVIIKSEYTARMTADDEHVLVEESFDEHTYPRRGGASVSTVLPAIASAAAVAAVLMEPGKAELEDPTSGPHGEEQQLHSITFADKASLPNSCTDEPRQNKWVRLCAPCYQNCLRARRNNVLQQLKNANLCILDDGLYYYHVMTQEELCQLSTALSKPDSLKKQVELISHVVMERSVDYVAAAPGYSAQTLATAMQHAPDVLRTLGGISAYAFHSARQTANDYVGGYFAVSRTTLPEKPVGAATTAALRPQSTEHDAYRSVRCSTGDNECSEASVESLDDTCSETQSPSSSPGKGQGMEEEARSTAFQKHMGGG